MEGLQEKAKRLKESYKITGFIQGNIETEAIEGITADEIKWAIETLYEILEGED